MQTGRQLPEPPPPWLLRVRELLPHTGGKIVKLVGFLGTLAALGFSTIYICNNIKCPFEDPPPPQIVTVSPTEVIPGQEFDVIGKHLDRVEGVQLRKGQVVERLFLLPLSETGMVLAVPIGVDKAEYIIEIREQGEQKFVTTKHKLEVIGGSSHDGPQTTTIVFANLNWDTARLQNAIARFIVEKGYGYKTEAIPEVPGRVEDVWNSLLTGVIQVYMEVWLPNQRDEWEQALENASVIPLGKSLDLAWQSAFVVPTYMVEENPRPATAHAPGLVTVQDLRNYTEVFAKPGSGGRAVLWNCPAIQNCSKITQKQVRAYGLDDVIEFRDPGSDEALDEKLLLANESRLAWLGYMWGPRSVTSKVSLTPLEERRCAVGKSPKDGCGYGASRVRIAVHPSLIFAAPDIVKLLGKWDFKVSTQIAAEDCLQETRQDFDKAAVCYLKAEGAVWAQWMPTEVAKKVRDALKKE